MLEPRQSSTQLRYPEKNTIFNQSVLPVTYITADQMWYSNSHVRLFDSLHSTPLETSNECSTVRFVHTAHRSSGTAVAVVGRVLRYWSPFLQQKNIAKYMNAVEGESRNGSVEDQQQSLFAGPPTRCTTVVVELFWWARAPTPWSSTNKRSRAVLPAERTDE